MAKLAMIDKGASERRLSIIQSETTGTYNIIVISRTLKMAFGKQLA